MIHTIHDLLNLPGSSLLALDQVERFNDRLVRMVGTPQAPVCPLILIVHKGKGVVRGLWCGVQPWRMTTYPMNVPLSTFNPKTWGGSDPDIFAQAMIAHQCDRKAMLRPAIPFILEATSDGEIEATLLCQPIIL